MWFIFKEKHAKKLIFAPKITLRTECSDTAQNPNFRANFLNARLQCIVSFSATEEILNR
jgi:hypothetical protein